MSNIVAMRDQITMGRYTPAQFDLIRKSHADLTETEFNQFMHVAMRSGLDPLRKQIYGILHNANKPDKRQLTIVIGIDGYRTMAERTGNYRPNDRPAEFVYRDELKGSANPLGIESCTVTVYKHSHGDWWPVVATAYWDEYAPIKDKAWNNETRQMERCEPRLDDSGKWAKMPRQMLEKCATAKAIRSGWPDDFAGVYDEAEMEAPTLDLTATEIVEQHQKQERIKKIGANDAIMIDLPDDDEGLRYVHVDKFADTVLAYIKRNPGADEIQYFMERNRLPMNAFWTARASDCLQLKQEIEKATKAAKEKEQANDPD